MTWFNYFTIAVSAISVVLSLYVARSARKLRDQKLDEFGRVLPKAVPVIGPPRFPKGDMSIESILYSAYMDGYMRGATNTECTDPNRHYDVWFEDFQDDIRVRMRAPAGTQVNFSPLNGRYV